VPTNSKSIIIRDLEARACHLIRYMPAAGVILS